MTIVSSQPPISDACEQAARWFAQGARFNEPAADTSVYPRGLRLADPRGVAGNLPLEEGSQVWAVRGLPERGSRGESASAKAAVGFTLSPSPAVGGGLATPSRVVQVRVTAAAMAQRDALAVLSEAQRLFALGTGRRFAYTPTGAESGLSTPGGHHGLIGLPPPSGVGAAGATVWRVLTAIEVVSPQPLSSEIDAATANRVIAAEGLASAMMEMAIIGVGATVPQPLRAFTVKRTLTADDRAAIRVRARTESNASETVFETALWSGGEAAHTVIVPGAGGVGTTIGDVRAALAAQGWTIADVDASKDARPAGHAWCIDWQSIAEGASNPGVGVYVFA